MPNYFFIFSIIQRIAELEKRNKKLVELLEKQNLSTALQKANNQLAMIGELCKKSVAASSHPAVVSIKKKVVTKQSNREHDDNDSYDNDDDDEDDDDKESAVDENEVAVARRGSEGDLSDEESEEDTNANIKEMAFEMHDFRWKWSTQQAGYLVVPFDDSNVNEKVDLKTMLHHFPEKVICFMWEKYSKS
jgi:hypothetical protein